MDSSSAAEIIEPEPVEVPTPALSGLLPHCDLLLHLIDRCNLPISLHLWSKNGGRPQLVYANRSLRVLAGATTPQLASAGSICLAAVEPALEATDTDASGPLVFKLRTPVVHDHQAGPCDTMVASLVQTAEGQFLLARIVDHLDNDASGDSNREGEISQDELAHASRALVASIEQMLKTTSEADEGSSNYHTALIEFREVLESQPDLKSVTAAVNRISEHTVHLASEFQKTRQKLIESSERIEELRVKLDDTTRRGLIDSLTTVGNRQFFDIESERILEEAKKTGTPFCVLMADIDHFKAFNDEHGHQTGDMILRMVGRSLSSKVRSTDIVARYGGEEFAVVLPGSRIAQARSVAEKIRTDVAQRRFRKRISGEHLGGVTISIGVAEWSRGTSLEDVIEAADRALYAAKRAGRNRVATSTD